MKLNHLPPAAPTRIQTLRTNLIRIVLLFLTCASTNCTDEQNPVMQIPDRQPPRVEWLSAASGEVRGEIELQFLAYDNVRVDSVAVYRNGIAPAEWRMAGWADSLYSLAWNTAQSPDGAYLLEARAWDGEGNVGSSPVLSVKVGNTSEPPDDRTPPEVWWTSPEPGSTLNGIVPLKLSFFDESGVDSVQLSRNGGLEATVVPQADSLTYTWNTVSDSDGVQVWEARAWDSAGNVGETSSLLLRVRNISEPPAEDRTPPVAAWVAPQSDSALAGTVTLRFQVLDDIAVDSVRVFRNGRSPEEFYLPGHAELDYELEWNTAASSDGLYLLEVRAWDASGNLGASPGLAVTVDNSPEPPPEDTLPPDVWWDAPSPGATLHDTVALRLRWFDESGVDSLRLIKNGAAVLTVPTEGGEGSYEYQWQTNVDEDGVYLWDALAWDSSGNVGESTSLLLRVQNNPEPPPEDRTPPVIVWLLPEPGDTVEGRVELRFHVMDDVGVDSAALYVNGHKGQNFKDMEEFNDLNVTWITTNLSDGNYILQVKAWDSSSNVGFSEVVWFHVWNDRPRVIWVPDEFETIQGAVRGSENGDTVMVRPGEYHESIQLLDKRISLMSSEGPEVTTIDATGYIVAIWVTEGQDSTCLIRGFTIVNYDDDHWAYGIYVEQSGPKIVNNIITLPNYFDQVRGNECVYGGMNWMIVRNNLFMEVGTGVESYLSWGDVSNNMMIHLRKGFHNAAIRGQALIPDFNLFWDYDFLFNEHTRLWGENNIDDQEPLFEEGSFRLREGSPGIDQGRPELSDLDGTRSDIGVYGGSHAYNQ